VIVPAVYRRGGTPNIPSGESIHHRLRSFDGVQTFAIKQYLHDICHDFSMMLSLGRPERIVVVEGIEINLPAATAIPSVSSPVN
jgi:hypothetical protein